MSSKFENISLEGGARATQLVRRYGDLYSEARLEALDALDALEEIAQFEDLKVKILFSVVVVSDVTHCLMTSRSQLRSRLLSSLSAQ